MRTTNVGTTRKGIRFIKTVAPLPKTQTEQKRRTRSLVLSDAARVSLWLNAAKRIGKESYQRVLGIRRELEELESEFNALRQQHKALVDTDAPLRLAQELAHGGSDYVPRKERFRKRHNRLNRVLAKYHSFRPALAYDLATGEWRDALISTDDDLGFKCKVSDGDITVNVRESDVVAALARLASRRDLAKVHLCANCQEQWHIAERNIDKFCSDKCRVHFHVHSDEYRERKKQSQRDYRARLPR